jgi:hypothetical protein
MQKYAIASGLNGGKPRSASTASNWSPTIGTIAIALTLIINPETNPLVNMLFTLIDILLFLV